jgi:hypothetical protein
MIALVMMIVLALGTAGVAYSFYSDWKEADGKVQDMDAKLKSRDGQLNKERALRAMYRMQAGLEEKDDIEGLPTYLKYKSDEVNVKQVFDDELKKFAERLQSPWDVDKTGQLRPKAVTSIQIAELKKQVDAAGKAKDEALAREKKASEEGQRILALANADKDNAVKNQNDAAQEAVKRFDKVADGFNQAQKKLADALPKADEDAATIEKLKADIKDLTAKLKAEQDKHKKEVDALAERIAQVDLLAKDKYKAKIFRLDPSGQLAYLNVGSADFVKPGLTFAIFGPGEYKPNAERKGSLEVVRVLNDHSCEARITEVKSRVQSPVMTGDELYNVAWMPGRREHVAISGFIDLTGEGKDQTQEFIKQLEKMGVTVDSYIDISTSPPTKRGSLSRDKTSFLILGEKPTLDVAEGASRELDPRLARRLEIRTAMDDLQKDAIANGITTVPVRRYMALIGMKVPKPSPDNWNAYDATPPAGAGGEAAPKPAAKKEAEPKKEVEKKEMEKKDEPKKEMEKKEMEKKEMEKKEMEKKDK